jgi:hypothetical protein
VWQDAQEWIKSGIQELEKIWKFLISMTEFLKYDIGLNGKIMFRKEKQGVFLNLNIETVRMKKCGAPKMRVATTIYISSRRACYT